MKQFEYHIRMMPYDVDELNGRCDLESELDEMGIDGWELVSIDFRKSTAGRAFAISCFKRLLGN